MYCNSGKTICKHLEIQKDDSGYCNVFHVYLKLSENIPDIIFIQDRDCIIERNNDEPGKVPDKPTQPPRPPKRMIVEDILMKKPVIQPGDINPICDICRCYIKSENPQPWPDGKYYHDDCILAKHGEKVNEFKPTVPVPILNSASSFLIKADDTIKQRGKNYDKQGDGESERSMGKTVKAFNEITGHNLRESEGWLLMLLLKQTRQYSTDEYHEDSALDSVAYSALLAESLSNE